MWSIRIRPPFKGLEQSIISEGPRKFNERFIVKTLLCKYKNIDKMFTVYCLFIFAPEIDLMQVNTAT